MQAIVYSSNTGFTAAYAALLAEKTGLPAYSLEEAQRALPAYADIVYMGWLMAGAVKGYRQAVRAFTVWAVCGVGMGACGSQIELVRKVNRMPAELPLFTLQGGFDMKRLRGAYRSLMRLMAATAGKKLAAKKDKTPEEADMLRLLQSGGSRVQAASLQPVLDFLLPDCDRPAVHPAE